MENRKKARSECKGRFGAYLFEDLLVAKAGLVDGIDVLPAQVHGSGEAGVSVDCFALAHLAILASREEVTS